MSKVVSIILCGGQSRRMGTDKSQLLKGDVSWSEYMATLFKTYVSQVYFSINSTQKSVLPSGDFIVDKYEDIGPYGGILSSLEIDSDYYWFSAVDLIDMQASVVKKMYEAFHKNLASAYLYKLSDDHRYPLCFIVDRKTIIHWQKKYDNQPMSIQRLLKDIKGEIVEVLMEENEINSFRNYNNL